MLEKDMCSHLVLCHQNPVTMHPEAFMPTKGFLEYLDTITIGTITTVAKEKEED